MYGFRLFKLSLTDRVSRRNAKTLKIEDLPDYLGCTLFDHFEECFSGLVDMAALVGKPKLGSSEANRDPVSAYCVRDDEEIERNTEQIIFKGTTLVSESILLAELDFGKFGTHQWLHGGGADSVDITKRAPSDTYRCAFFLPTNGDALIMATETKGRVNIAHRVITWLVLQGWSNGQMENVRGKSSMPPLGIFPTPVRDYESLIELIDSANDVKVRLTKKSVNPDSGRKAQEIEFQQRMMGAAKRDQVIDAIKSWIDRKSGNAEDQVKAGSVGIVEMADLTDLNLQDDGIDFNDGYISIQKGNESPKKITPNSLDDVFTYLLSETRMSDADWLAEVSHVIRRLEHDLLMDFSSI